VKLLDIAGKKKRKHMTAKIDELETNSKIKKISVLYRGHQSLYEELPAQN
jgi:hypothetical protein